jgi:hypothetical protein
MYHNEEGESSGLCKAEPALKHPTFTLVLENFVTTIDEHFLEDERDCASERKGPPNNRAGGECPGRDKRAPL